MIKSFKSKALSELWSTGRSGKVDLKLQARIMVRFAAMNRATSLDFFNIPGFDFHPLRGFDPTRYSIHINGPWCLTFEFDGKDILRVDLEQYH